MIPTFTEPLSTTIGWNISESVLVLDDEESESKTSKSILTTTTSWISLTVETTNFTPVLAVAVTNLGFLSQPPSKPTPDSVANLPSVASHFFTSVTPSGLVDNTGPKNSTPEVPSTITALPPEKSVAEVKDTLDANQFSTKSSSLNPWSLVGVILGLMLATSLIVLIIFLMGRRRRRNETIHCDLISHRSSSNPDKPFESFTSIRQNSNQWKNFSRRIQDFVCVLIHKLGGKKSNPLPYGNSSDEKVDLDRGNSQFFNDNTHGHNHRNTSSVVQFLPASSRGYGTRWSLGQNQEMDSPESSNIELSDPFGIENIAESQTKFRDPSNPTRISGVNGLHFQPHIKPNQAVLVGKRLSDFDNNKGDKSPRTSKFHEDESCSDSRHSQILVSQTVTQYRSDSQSSKSPVSPQDPSFLTSAHNGNRDSIYSSASCYTNERNNKKKSDQFDLDYPDLWRLGVKSDYLI